MERARGEEHAVDAGLDGLEVGGGVVLPGGVELGEVVGGEWVGAGEVRVVGEFEGEG